MDNWDQTNPETAPGVMPPQLATEPELPDTPLVRLRLRQLHDLADAFDIRIDKTLTKNQILPSMIAAEQRGVFKNPRGAKQSSLMRASWAHGEGKFPADEIEQLEATERAPVKRVLGHEGARGTPGLKVGLQIRQDLIARCREIEPDINTHHMKNVDLEAWLEEHDVS